MKKYLVFPLLFAFVLSFLACNSNKKIEDIVIIDVSDFGREIIAREVFILDSLNPKVLAIDLQFSTRKETMVDSLLEYILSGCDNLIMVSVIDDNYSGEDLEYKNLTSSLPEFIKNAKTGFTNVILEDDEFETLKRFSTYEKVGGKIEYHFSVQTAMAFDSLKTMSFLKKHPKIVDVKYNSSERFKIFSAADVLEKKITTKEIEGKIVLVGSFSPFDYDVFFSPLNNKKKPYKPDMYGVVYLANVVAQILHEENVP